MGSDGARSCSKPNLVSPTLHSGTFPYHSIGMSPVFCDRSVPIHFHPSARMGRNGLRRHSMPYYYKVIPHPHFVRMSGASHPVVSLGSVSPYRMVGPPLPPRRAPKQIIVGGKGKPQLSTIRIHPFMNQPMHRNDPLIQSIGYGYPEAWDIRQPP